MDSTSLSKCSHMASDETSSLIGQELVNFVIKASESLHNVILKAKTLPSHQSFGRKKLDLKKKHFKTKSMKSKVSTIKTKEEKSNEINVTDNCESNSLETTKTDECSNDYQVFQKMNPNIEELYDIPMEELLSSPSWKQIVAQNSQNSFYYPSN